MAEGLENEAAMATGILKIATCQFAVGKDIRRNARQICEFLRRARKAKADIVLFSECALSGYVGTDFPSFAGFEWDLLKEETKKIVALASELGLWVVLGSTHIRYLSSALTMTGLATYLPGSCSSAAMC